MNDSSPASAAPQKGRWLDILKGRQGIYTLVVNLGILTFAVDSFLVTGVMPTVVADIGGMRLYSWTFALFSVGSVIGASSAGPLREAFGARNGYALPGLVFFAGLVIAASAPSMHVLVFARFIQGLGGGAIASQGFALIAMLVPDHLRGRVLAFTSTAWGVATVLGPGFGGVFANMGEWRGAFWALSPLSLIFTALAFRFIPQTEGHKRLSALPYTRLLLLASSVLSLSLTSQVDTMAVRFGLIVLSIVLAVTALRRDAKADRPMFPRQTLRIGTQLGAMSWILLLNSSTIVFVNTFTTLQMQVLHGETPLTAAYIYISVSTGWSLSSFVVATWHDWKETLAIVLGLIFVVIGAVGVEQTVIAGPVWMIVCFMGTIGTGVGFLNNPLIQRAIRIAAPAERHIAGSSVQAMRNMGIAFGAASAGMVAVAAGLVSDVATPDIVGPAMAWVYRVAVIVAFCDLACVIPMLMAARRSRLEETPS